MPRAPFRRLAVPLAAFSLAGCAGESPTPILPGAAGSSAGVGASGGLAAGGAGAGGMPSVGGSAGVAAGTGGSAAGAGGASGSGTGGAAGLGGAGAGSAGESGSAGVSGAAGAAAAGGAAGDGGSAGAGAAGVSGSGGAGGGGAPNGGAAGSGGGGAGRPARVLLYSFSTLDIPTIDAQLDTLQDQLEAWQFGVDKSEDPAVFSDENLEKYAAVGMINTCFSPFGQGQNGATQGQVLQRFLRAGGGLFGTHCADVTFQSANPPALYNQLLGGRASSQNFEGMSQCSKVGDHPTTAGLPATFTYSGNLDGTDYIAPDTNVLVKCRWNNGTGQEVAVSWVRTEEFTGRVFFSNFGKVNADLTNATIGAPHLLAGLGWVLGR
jgi:hypothetical protein